MLVSAGRVPKQCLRLVQVFLPPIGTVKSAHFPGLVWQFNHLQKRHFLRAKAHVLPTVESKWGFALVWRRQEFWEAGSAIPHLDPSHSQRSFPVTRDWLPVPSWFPIPTVQVRVRNVPALVIDFITWGFSYDLGFLSWFILAPYLTSLPLPITGLKIVDCGYLTTVLYAPAGGCDTRNPLLPWHPLCLVEYDQLAAWHWMSYLHFRQKEREKRWKKWYALAKSTPLYRRDTVSENSTKWAVLTAPYSRQSPLALQPLVKRVCAGKGVVWN